jgi:putative ABC transport system permease protein
MWTRTPAFSVAALVTLALGLGAATALFSVCDRILFRSLPYRDADRLVSVGLVAPLDANEFLLGPDYAQLWRATPAPFESATTVTAGTSSCDLTESRPERLTCASVEANLLSVLGLSVAAGRDFRASDDKPGAARVALITHGLWLRRFAGDPALTGRTLILDGRSVEVVGVLPITFELPTLAAADVLLPQQLSAVPGPGGIQFLRGFARLKPGVTPQQAYAGLQPLFHEMLKNVPPAFRAEVTMRVRPLRDRQLGDARRAAWFLLGAVGALLLIACTNVANLLLARSITRQRELAIRAALGAGRARLARLALTESALLALAGGALGLFVAWMLLRTFITLAPRGIPKLDQASLDLRAVGAALGLALVAALLIGIWPSLSVPRPAALQGARSIASVRPWARFSFVVMQIGLTFALLGTSTLLLRSLWEMEKVPLGFETQRVLSAAITLNAARYPTPERQVAFFEQLLQRAAATPGTVVAAVTDSLPPSGNMRSMIYARIEVAGRPLPKEGTGGMVPWRLVTPGYFDALHIPIVRGRAFTDADRTSTQPAMILSETLERKLFPTESALGKQLRPGGREQPWHIVVGIAKDTRNAGLTVRPEPEYYVVRGITPRDATRRSFVIVRTQAAPRLAAAVLREAVASIDRELPVSVDTMQQRVSELSARPRFTAFLLVAFGVLAILLAATGLAGVAGYLVTERTRDIGIRIALGATPAVVRREVLIEAARWVAGGAALGLLLAMAFSRIVGTLLYGVTPNDPWAWSAALLILSAVSFAAALRPALRASRIDPMSALRTE